MSPSNEPIDINDLPRSEIFEAGPEQILSPETAAQFLQLMPEKFPDKHTMVFQRKAIVEHLVGKFGYLRAYLLMKYIEKLFLDKEDGAINQVKDAAAADFREAYGEKGEVCGVNISTRQGHFYVYPKEVVDFEAEVEQLKLKLKGMKKAAEIDGSATKYADNDKTITIKFG